MATEFICNGAVTYNADGTVRCTDWLEVNAPVDLIASFADLAITPENILYVYAWGMGAILLPWSLGFAVGAAKKVINTA